MNLQQHYTGNLEKGIVVINNLNERGRWFRLDIFLEVRKYIPLDLNWDEYKKSADWEKYYIRTYRIEKSEPLIEELVLPSHAEDSELERTVDLPEKR